MSPVELVKKYNDENYDIISITDHDNIKAFQEAKIAGEALNITVVPGVELSTEHTLTLEADADAQHPAGSEVSVELHLLGYQFDPQNEALVRRLAELEENRKARNEQLAAVLTAMGYPVDLQALAAASKGGYVGKPHIARAWVAQGLIAQLKDAWEPGKRLESPEVKAIRKKRWKRPKPSPCCSRRAVWRCSRIRARSAVWENGGQRRIGPILPFCCGN